MKQNWARRDRPRLAQFDYFLSFWIRCSNFHSRKSFYLQGYYSKFGQDTGTNRDSPKLSQMGQFGTVPFWPKRKKWVKRGLSPFDPLA